MSELSSNDLNNNAQGGGSGHAATQSIFDFNNSLPQFLYNILASFHHNGNTAGGNSGPLTPNYDPTFTHFDDDTSRLFIDDCGVPIQSQNDPRNSHFRFWLDGVAVAVFALFGLFGNALTLIVLNQPRLRNVFHQLLCALACFDLLYIGCGGLNYTFRAFRASSDVFTYMFPYVIYPLTNVAMCGTIFMTVAISIERYIGLCHPMLPPASRKAWFYIVPVIILAFAFNGPKFFEIQLKIERREVVNTNVESSWNSSSVITTKIVPSYTNAPLRFDETYIRIYVMWIQTICTAIVPVCMILFLNIRIIVDLFKSRTKVVLSGRQMYSLGQNLRNNCSSISPKSSSNVYSAPSYVASSPSSSVACCSKRDVERVGRDVRGNSIVDSNDFQLKNILHEKNNTSSRSQLQNSMSNNSGGSVVSACTVGGGRVEGGGGSTSSGDAAVTPRSNSNQQSISASLSGSGRKMKEINLCLVLLHIVVVFFLCHSPRIMLDIFEFSNIEKVIACRPWFPPLWLFTCQYLSHAMMIFNSSVNFVIYCLVGHNFRDELSTLIKHWANLCGFKSNIKQFKNDNNNNNIIINQEHTKNSHFLMSSISRSLCKMRLMKNRSDNSVVASRRVVSKSSAEPTSRRTLTPPPREIEGDQFSESIQQMLTTPDSSSSQPSAPLELAPIKVHEASCEENTKIEVEAETLEPLLQHTIHQANVCVV